MVLSSVQVGGSFALVASFLTEEIRLTSVVHGIITGSFGIEYY